MWTMAKKDWKVAPGKDGTYSKTIRFEVAEVERLNVVLERMQHRPNAKAASLNQAMKELLGVANYGLVTAKDRKDIAPNTPKSSLHRPDREDAPEREESSGMPLEMPLEPPYMEGRQAIRVRPTPLTARKKKQQDERKGVRNK